MFTDDVVDVRGIIERLEELEAEVEPYWGKESPSEDEIAILASYGAVQEVLEELKGNGGDEQWRGDWYPVTLIADSHFRDYAEQLAEDCGMIEQDAPWPVRHIDWEAAAEELKGDYTSIEIDGNTFWYR